MNLDEPLAKGVWVKAVEDKHCVDCKYERIGDFCYNCGNRNPVMKRSCGRL